MCIIAIKEVGVKFPDQVTIENMFDNNPDGAGFMYAHNGQVYIEKGFMDLKDFNNRIKKLSKKINLENTAMVMHFRITTHGGTQAKNCHPFPISNNIKDLEKLNFTTDIGVAHNGIIHIETDAGVSDTMQFVKDRLSIIKKMNKRFYENKYAMELIEELIGSKMAFLTKEGKVYTVGKFEREKSGMVYSNTSYLYNYYTTRYSKSTKNTYDYGKNSGAYAANSWAMDDYYSGLLEDDPWAYSYSSDTTRRFIYPLGYEDDARVKDNNGTTYSAVDFGVDYLGNLYEYDEMDGIAYPVKGMALVGKNPYNSQLTEWMTVSTKDMITYA